jgi:hypothetical protein
MKLIDFAPSTIPSKRFMVVFSDPGRIVHFGHRNKSTFVDHGNVGMRDNHVMRQACLNEDRFWLNDNTLNTSVLWGPTRSVEANLALFLKEFKITDAR